MALNLFRRSPDAQRRRRLASTPESPVRDFLATPFPTANLPLAALPLLAIDLETTGLDPARDRILSVGFVPVDGDAIALGGARHVLICPDEASSVGASATVHGITDDALAVGMGLQEALEITLEALQGRVLLAHYARVEVEFIARACQQVFGATPVFPVADTMQLGHDLVLHRHGAVPRGALRLWALRRRFGLPTYKTHHALGDALACAELYLALTAELGLTKAREVLRCASPRP